MLTEYILKKIAAVFTAIIMMTNGGASVKNQTEKAVPTVGVRNLQTSTVSVSCIIVEWDADKNRDYEIYCEGADGAEYTENIYIEVKSNSLCYLTGLRENSAYNVKITPILKDGEKAKIKSAQAKCKTEQVEVIWDFPYEDGWTNCFAYESSAGLTANPSWGAIQNCSVDKVTNTGIMRDEYGDYCCAMGTFYGYCGDRFLVELENGTQFTVKICDSKGGADDGEGRYHNFGSGGKCVIEFIHDPNSLPGCVSFTGNYGSYNWSGLNFDNIRSVKKINYGKKIEY